MKIGITGANGLIGWHLRAYLKSLNSKDEVRLAYRDTFTNLDQLTEFVKGTDAIFHFAGMNRGPDAELETVNPELARKLVSAFEKADTRPHLIFSNSTHQDRDTAYGRGKKEAAKIFQAWSGKTRAPFTNLILPHVFGEFGKPFYNSVVSTFCHQLAHQETPKIIDDGKLELLHAQDLASKCMQIIHDKKLGDQRLQGTPVTVSSLMERLTQMDQQYRSMIVPSLETPLDVRLFNTLRSYLFPKHYPVTLKVHSDDRGYLFESVKCKSGGQSFISATRPGITRGNHFHTKKFERFVVTSGEAEIRLRKVFDSEKETVKFTVRGDQPSYVDIPTFYTHDITNIGKSEMVTLFWTNEIFDPAHSDTISEPVGAK
jgi:UDP-2-acetamido-2,6-beta-L-arabino-hexul-4-ose reductase